MIPVPSTLPPRGCLPARRPPATPLSQNTPPGLPPLLQGDPSPNLSCYFTNTATSDLLQASKKPDEPLITTEYIKNISKFSLVPRQKETKTTRIQAWKKRVLLNVINTIFSLGNCHPDIARGLMITKS